MTKKVRRVGSPDWDLVRAAVAANGGAPTVRLALTMVDQMFPRMRDRTFDSIDAGLGGADTGYWDYHLNIERQSRAMIGMITTGPNSGSFTDWENGQ